MNKYAAEKIASEYYNLGIQLALQNAGLLKTARPTAMDRKLRDENDRQAFEAATPGINIAPYTDDQPLTHRLAKKYDMSREAIDALGDAGTSAIKRSRGYADIGNPYGRMHRALDLPYGTAQVPYMEGV